MLNAAQFSAAKNLSETKMMQSLLFNERKERQSFSAFKADAKEVTDVFNETWLRTEYDTSVRQCVAGAQFMRFRDDADIYPYWQYLRTNSLNPRDYHLVLVGNVYRIGDPEGDLVAPPGDWLCGCGMKQLSDYDMEDGGFSVRTADQIQDDLKDINPQFRYNPADQGILPKESHSYFEVLKSANEADGKLFGIHGNTSKGSTKLSSKGLHNMLTIFHKWQHKYKSDLETVTFQNAQTFANVKFNQKAFQTISKHSAGFEQLDETVINPDEIWSYWTDPKKQLSVKRNYIKGRYIVTTEDGIITNGFLAEHVNQFRKGVPV